MVHSTAQHLSGLLEEPATMPTLFKPLLALFKEKGDEIALDTSIFGIPGGITPESEIGPDMYGPSLPQGYQDFDLTELTNQLFSRDIEKYDRKMGGFDSDEKFDTKLNLSLEDLEREDSKPVKPFGAFFLSFSSLFNCCISSSIVEAAFADILG